MTGSLLGRLFTIILVAIGGLAFVWLVVVRLIARLGGAVPCPYSLAWLVDNPLRRRRVGLLLDRLGIQPGERILELGPGPGVFTCEAARRTLPGGSLVAVDIQPKMIAALDERVREAGLTNVETHVADAYHLPVPDGSVDRAFLVTVLPEIPDQERALAELYRVLREPDPETGTPSGLLSVTEEFLDPDYRLPWTTVRQVEAAGFVLEVYNGGWWLYMLNFRKDGIE